jgi:hypothetical protein
VNRTGFVMSHRVSALDLLTAQHDELERLIEALEAAGDGGARHTRFVALADALSLHAALEESIFYPWLYAHERGVLSIESPEVHLALRRLLADMTAISVEGPIFEATLAILKREVRRHARDEEEGRLFREVRDIASSGELDTLGAVLAFFTKEH